MISVFFLNLIISTGYIASIGHIYAKYKLSNNVFILFFPLIFLWVLICGGQYDVGTDYFSYLETFNGKKNSAERHGEYLFHYIIVVCNYLGLKGQSLFFIFYGIGFTFLFLYLKKLQIKYIFIYIILYITVANLFNNQLNILRQSLAIYIGTYGSILYFYNKKIWSILLIIIASLFHVSALIFFLVYFFNLFHTTSKVFYILILITSFAIGHIFQIEWVNLLLNIDFLPSHYLYFLKTVGVETLQLSRILTKYIFIPFYLFSIFQVDKNKLTKTECHLFFIGFVSFCLRLLTVKLFLVSRITDSFILFSIFPLYFYFREILRKKKYIIFSILIACLFIMYFFKTIVFVTPGKEYFYRSIIFE